MINADMPRDKINRNLEFFRPGVELPLQIVWSRVFVLSLGTEGADIARRSMNQSVPNHLVLPLESLAALGS